MPEETEAAVGTTEEATATPASSYADVLNAEGATAPDGAQGEDEANSNTQDQGEDAEAVKAAETDPEFVLREGLKAKLSEIEEWKKGAMLQKDYTQKTQQIAEVRKSLETAFGGKLPDRDSLQNLGRLYQAYFSDERVQKTIDAILAGGQVENSDDEAGDQNESEKVSPYVKRLEAQLQQLEQRLEQREYSRVESEAQKTWESWVSNRQKADKTFAMNEDIDLEMGALIPGVRQRHPDWDHNKILDHAYRLATIENQPAKIAEGILKDADEKKGSNPPKINPKSGTKPIAELNYSDLLNG